MSFVRAASVAALAFASFTVFSCTSADFNTAPTGNTDDSGAGDTLGTDGAVDPCAKIPDVARFCVTVGKVDAHPGYTAGSGFDALGLDGIGTLKVYLFSEDPGDPTRVAPVKPILSIPFPADGTTIDIDKDLPVSIADSAPEGDYWFTVVFEDNGSVTRSDSYAATYGDFIVVPPVVDNRLVFPKVTLVKGDTKPIPVSLKPLRQIAATVQIAPALVALAKTRPEIHGDGPMGFLIYRGDISATGGATFFDLAYTHCIDLEPKIGETIPVSFGSILAPGNYKVLGLLFDYDYLPPAAKDFPGPGTIVSPYADGAVEKVVNIAIAADRWLANINVDMVDIPVAPGGATDKQLCPGAK